MVFWSAPVSWAPPEKRPRGPAVCGCWSSWSVPLAWPCVTVDSPPAWPECSALASSLLSWWLSSGTALQARVCTLVLREEWRVTELRMLWALTGRFSPASFTRALPTGREAVLTLPLPPPLTPAPPPPSLSEPRNVLRMPPSSGRFLILKETFQMVCFFFCSSGTCLRSGFSGTHTCSGWPGRCQPRGPRWGKQRCLGWTPSPPADPCCPGQALDFLCHHQPCNH